LRRDCANGPSTPAFTFQPPGHSRNLGAKQAGCAPAARILRRSAPDASAVAQVALHLVAFPQLADARAPNSVQKQRHIIPA
jgi:hypothetical protein